ncbi:DHA2 family multidrug resistance protein-like MFS transporter [Nocardiopsis mwathae]|uniref:DHA2 family multidrug resistance protein-like MFS transporter n=1 Tax=Nocardiopsis mwathae TaxID=1472723 RepID=A0A7W9YF51_9ACTN|nr:MFS transporter [Nocardiopsis mwathae]MBB6170952.1 DHA2 family multidrug resistance protein-like MFS transporter [Nocardiopsis mwathae]
MRRASGGRAGPREWAGLAVLALPTMLLGLDVTVLHLALPSLAADLRPTGTQELWIVDAYGFLIAGFLITMGTVGDRIGRRRLLLIGGVAFVAASLAAAYSTSAEMLIAARAALGIAGATLMPSTLALISNMFADARQRALAIGMWVMFFALGMAAGPLVGGALVEYFRWGAAFLVAVPVIGTMLVAAPFLLPEYRAPDSGRLDLPSVALSLAAILPVVYGIKQFAKDGPQPEVVAALAAGAVFAVVFVRRQRTLADPFLDVTLFRNRAFGVALGMMLVGLVGVGGTMLLVTQYLQLVADLPPLTAGLLYGPPALMMMLSAVAAPLVARRVRPGYVVAGVLAVSAGGYALLAVVGSDDGVPLVVAGFSLIYLGLGAIAVLGTDLVVGAAPPEKAGSASAMSETVQDFGLAAGIALLGSLATAVYRRGVEEQADGLPADVAVPFGDSLSGAASVAARLPDSLLDQARASFTAGLNTAGAVGAVGVLVLAALTAVTLRHIGTIGTDDPGDASGDGAGDGATEPARPVG